ncbi:glycosyltransferase [Lolliginicoccus levis]|uniref:glycosyltransferase n=1 Tax=Lolliginicoccus levis TaxID=2919542 RepID=UPI00241EA5EB|nr:glycosyltransferase [Lolliginicoccus levis]
MQPKLGQADHPTILWLAHSGSPTGGGELSLVASVQVLASRGFDVVVVVPTDEGLGALIEQAGGTVLVVRYGWWVRQAPSSRRGVLDSMRSVAVIRGVIERRGVDLVVSNSVVVPWAALAARLAGANHVWFIREFGFLDHGYRYFLGERIVHRLVARDSSLIVANSEALARFLRDRGATSTSVRVVHPLVQRPIRSASKSPRMLGSPLRLLMVGVISEGKGQLDVVSAIASLQGYQHAPVELVLVGHASPVMKRRILDLTEALHLPSGLVRFEGFQPDPIPYMHDADVFIMASRCEAFGRVTVEAMACGLPVIGARSGGTPGLVEDGVTGLLYEPGCIAGLARSIEQLAADPGLRSRMGTAGRTAYERRFSPERCSTDLVAAINDARQPPRGSGASAWFVLVALGSLMNGVVAAKRVKRALERGVRRIALSISRRDPATLFAWSGERRGKSTLDGSRRLSVIVPVFGDWDSLQHNIASVCGDLAGNPACDVYYVNDCGPQADELERRILAAIEGIDNVHYARNPRNLGFVGNCNNAALNLVDQASDVLLLNSDTIVTSGFAEEMQRVLYAEGMRFGAVTSRSNAATIFSVPMNEQLPMEQAYVHYLDVVDGLPQWYEAPVAHGFCMMIRREVIRELGLFDEAYGKGYGEENDFCMRIRRQGWRCAVANRSFVFHFRARSFTPKTRDVQVSANEKILDSRYPEYRQLVRQYKESVTEPALR